jgi:dUTPase
VAPLKVILINHGPSVFDVKVGDRIGQLVISAVPLFPAVEVKELSDSSYPGRPASDRQAAESCRADSL